MLSTSPSPSTSTAAALLSEWESEDWLTSSISEEVEEIAELRLEQEREARHLEKIQEELIEAAPPVSLWDVLTSPLGEIGYTLKEWRISREVNSVSAELAAWDKKLNNIH